MNGPYTPRPTPVLQPILPPRDPTAHLYDAGGTPVIPPPVGTKS